MSDKPLCLCHAEPMYWAKDRRCRAGGYWRCAVNQREHHRISHQKFWERRRAQQHDYWHRADGGWLSERRRRLRFQRERITDQLAKLAEERAHAES